MVFADLNSIENDMASIASGGGSFTNLTPSLPQPTKPNPQTTAPTTNSIPSTSNEISLPSYDVNDPEAVLKALIRFIMHTFYEVPKSLVIEYIYHYEQINQQDLANLLCLDPKLISSYIEQFKRDKFIEEVIRLEPNVSKIGRRNQVQYYYKINTTTFINVAKYRLINMQTYVENLDRQQTYKQSNYKCELCSKEYTELDIGKLYDVTQDTLLCLMCGGNVHEDIETKKTTVTNQQVANMSLFNEQMKPLFQLLERIDKIVASELQMKNSTDPDFSQQNGNVFSLTPHSNNKDTTSNAHRSHASNVFDRTSTINHGIEIIIEKDDDDHYSGMDVDETGYIDSLIGSSRGPGKSGKKSGKPVQSTAEAASQPLSSKMRLASKKAPYEPKPLPHWFVRSTVHVDQDEEFRLNNLSLNPTGHSSGISRQLSQQKLIKSNSLNDIKQMLLIHESRRKKTLPLTTMEDSLSPPTPIQMTKTTDSQ